METALANEPVYVLAAVKACTISRPVFQVAPRIATLCCLTASTSFSHWSFNCANACDHVVAPTTIPKPFAYCHLNVATTHTGRKSLLNSRGSLTSLSPMTFRPAFQLAVGHGRHCKRRMNKRFLLWGFNSIVPCRQTHAFHGMADGTRASTHETHGTTPSPLKPGRALQTADGAHGFDPYIHTLAFQTPNSRHHNAQDGNTQAGEGGNLASPQLSGRNVFQCALFHDVSQELKTQNFTNINNPVGR